MHEMICLALVQVELWVSTLQIRSTGRELYESLACASVHMMELQGDGKGSRSDAEYARRVLSPLAPQSQYLMVPSQLQVATREGSTGCQMAWMHTWSWHLSLRNTLHDFQSQNQSRPSESPDMT